MENRRAILIAVFVAGFVSPITNAAPADLCQGLVKNDKAVHPVPANVAKPAVGKTMIDPTFGTTIRRVTDVQATYGSSSYGIKPMYSTVPAWNADETYFILYRVGGGHMLFNGKTYAFIRDLNISPPDLEQVFWHTTDPDVFFYVQNSGKPVLIRYHVSTNTKEQLRDFSKDDNGQAFCSGEVNTGDDTVFNSWDSNFFSFRCTSPQSVFLYDVGANKIIKSKATTAELPPQLGSGGTRTLWYRGVTDMALNYQRSISIDGYDSHASLGRSADGRDIYTLVAFDPPNKVGCIEPEPSDCLSGDIVGKDNDYVGNLVYYDLTDTANPIMPKIVIGPKTGYNYPQTTHVSAVAHKNPGWILVTVDDQSEDPNGTDLLDQELIYAYIGPDDAARGLHNGDVCRAAHHRSHGKGNRVIEDPYFAEAHGSPSPSGTRVLFGSDWGGGPTIDTYVVELPAYSQGRDALPPARPQGLRVR
jgi:hypothetical protein